MTANAEHPDTCNTSLTPDTLLQDRYRIVRQLGRGGMGAVYEAVDERLGITVALKETLSTEAAMRKQFEHEARLLAGMQHPALPRVSDHFVEGNRAFLVMQFIGGVDLAKIIAQQPGPFPRDQVIAWADQLLDALIYLHSRDRQVIHRDIKPHNLKLTATGQIALLDFGLAKAQSPPSVDQSVTASRAFFGYTKHYAPLEQIQDQRTDTRSDIYALGATLYHLLTGIKPPDALVRATALINSEPDPLRPANAVHPAVGRQVSTILSKAMAQKSEERYATATEFREALRRIGRTTTNDISMLAKGSSSSRKTTAHRENDIEPTVMKMSMVASSRRFGPAGMTALVVIVLAFGAGGFYGSQRWYQSPPQQPAETPDAPAKRSHTSARNAERQRFSINDSLVTATRNQTDTDKNQRVNEKREVPVTSAASMRRPAEQRTIAPAKTRRPVSVPSIRLPNPEVRENVPSPGESAIRNYGSSRLVPRFYRAPDGTQIVKFSDGSSRTIRPGERSGH